MTPQPNSTPNQPPLSDRIADATEPIAQVADEVSSVDKKVGRNTGFWIRLGGGVASAIARLFGK